jgi:hypothetical protein
VKPIARSLTNVNKGCPEQLILFGIIFSIVVYTINQTLFPKSKKMNAEPMNASLANVKLLVSLLERDIIALAAGRKNAAPQARKNASAISKGCGALRVSILEFQKSIPVVKREPKEKKETDGPLDIDVEAETAKAVAEMPSLHVPEMDLPPGPPKLRRQRAGSKNTK